MMAWRRRWRGAGGVAAPVAWRRWRRGSVGGVAAMVACRRCRWRRRRCGGVGGVEAPVGVGGDGGSRGVVGGVDADSPTWRCGSGSQKRLPSWEYAMSKEELGHRRVHLRNATKKKT